MNRILIAALCAVVILVAAVGAVRSRAHEARLRSLAAERDSALFLAGQARAEAGHYRMLSDSLKAEADSLLTVSGTLAAAVERERLRRRELDAARRRALEGELSVPSDPDSLRRLILSSLSELSHE